MRKLMVVLGVLGGLSMPGLVLSAQTSGPAPALHAVACSYLDWADRSLMIESGGPQEEQDYDAGVAAAYKAWCTPGDHTAEEKAKGANEMAAAWKALWERKTPFNTTFHNSGPMDMLALLGITHELPPLMKTDSALTKEFAEGCEKSCFSLWLDPEEPADQARLISVFRLYRDVQRNLKREPAAEPVQAMLKNAKFSLGG